MSTVVFFSSTAFACNILTPRFSCPHPGAVPREGTLDTHVTPCAAGYGVLYPCTPSQFLVHVDSHAGVSASHSGQEHASGVQPSPGLL